MYHTVFPSQMMVQLMGGHQTGGQCPPSQTHALHINGINALHQSDFTQYGPNISGHNRHRTIQTGSPLDLLQLIGVDVPSLRRIEYMQPNNNSSSANWERRTTNNASIIPFSNYNFKPTNTNSTKKPNWYRNGRRNSYRNSFSKYEAYNSDSGFSSRSPTPNKHYIDNSITESSDERDSTSSLRGHWLKKHHKVPPNNRAYNKPTAVGLISNACTHQFYQGQQSVNRDTTNSSQRSHVQNYQNRRKYVPDKNENAQRLPRNRKYFQVPSHDAFPGCITAPDSFLARSHLLQPTSMPSDIFNGSLWDDLSDQVWRKFEVNEQTADTYKRKMMLWKDLNAHIKTVFPNYSVFFGGSTMNGFASNESDVDICLLVKGAEMDQRYVAIEHLEELEHHLRQCDFVEQFDIIYAKVPIITFYDTARRFKADMNCNNTVGIKNTHLLYCYSKLDWRVKPLALVVKLWAQEHKINNPRECTLSSYSLVLMVIHFLQCGTSPPVLPCLHSMFPDKFKSDIDIYNIDIHENLNIPSSNLPKNCQSLGELLLAFFQYYDDFDFDKYAISVRLACKIPKEECRKNDPYQWKHLCIEEPFDLTNTARSVYNYENFTKILYILGTTHMRLKRTHCLSEAFKPLDLFMIYDLWVHRSDEESP